MDSAEVLSLNRISSCIAVQNFLHRVMDSGEECQLKRKRCKPEEDESRNGGLMDSLPREIALDIVSRLPITSLLQFMFARRAWKLLSLDPLLSSMHFSQALNSNPCLVFHCDYPIRNELYFVEFSDPDNTEKVRKFDTPFSVSMPEYNVVDSCNGLLCLSDSLFNDAIHIYNPFTRGHRALPLSRQFQEQEMVLGFGYHPGTQDYKVVKVVYYRNVCDEPWRARRFGLRHFPRSEVQIFTLSSNRWRSSEKVPYRIKPGSARALLNGRLHWVSQVGRYYGVRGRLIISFDLADEQFREVPRPHRVGTGIIRCNFNLVVLGGCLSAATCSPYGTMDIWVMKEYDVQESWIKEYHVGAYMPRLLNPDWQRSFGIWKNVVCRSPVRVICLLKNGDILIEYRHGTLVSHNPINGTFKNLMFDGLPDLFQTIAHVGSLNSTNL